MANTLAEQVEVPEAPIKPLPRSALRPYDSQFCNWTFTMPRGIKRNQLCNPGLVSVFAEQLHVYDRVFVLGEGRDFAAELLVLECGRGYAQLIELNYWPLPSLVVDSSGLPPGFQIIYTGVITPQGEGGYCAIRTCDSVCITKAHTSKESCLAALLDHGSLR